MSICRQKHEKRFGIAILNQQKQFIHSTVAKLAVDRDRTTQNALENTNAKIGWW